MENRSRTGAIIIVGICLFVSAGVFAYAQTQSRVASKVKREVKRMTHADAWEPYVGLDNQLKLLKCDGFEVSVFANSQVDYVLMKDKIAEQELKDRRAKAKEKAAAEAKP